MAQTLHIDCGWGDGKQVVGSASIHPSIPFCRNRGKMSSVLFGRTDGLQGDPCGRGNNFVDIRFTVPFQY